VEKSSYWLLAFSPWLCVLASQQRFGLAGSKTLRICHAAEGGCAPYHHTNPSASGAKVRITGKSAGATKARPRIKTEPSGRVVFLFSTIQALSIQHSAFSQSKPLSKLPARSCHRRKNQTSLITGKSAGATGSN
jgi:hypothetical protein